MGSLKSSCTKVSIRAGMFLIYLFAGAGMFMGIEKTNQDTLMHETKQKMDILKNDLKRRRNLTEQEFRAVQELVEESLDVGIIGSRVFLKTWDFANAFFFCGNVITTIGKESVHYSGRDNGYRLLVNMLLFRRMRFPNKGSMYVSKLQSRKYVTK